MRAAKGAGTVKRVVDVCASPVGDEGFADVEDGSSF